MESQGRRLQLWLARLLSPARQPEESHHVLRVHLELWCLTSPPRATGQSQDVAPATADAVERQVQDALASTAETPDERVARLQREAQEAAGIELEEEVPVSGLPPVEPTVTLNEKLLPIHSLNFLMLTEFHLMPG